jgi:LuxR family maltose regulon positive regulatory protein
VALARARVALAQRRPELATELLEDLLAAAPPSLVMGVTAGVLLAQALYRLGDVAGAAEQMELALRLAAPESIRAPFLGHGPWIARLLEGSASAEPAEEAEEAAEAERTEPAGDVFAVAPEHMAEPLTEREMLVLQYLRSMLSIAEIAAVLCVSANTVKTHVRHVYQKLGVSRRRDAVRRGRELSLI